MIKAQKTKLLLLTASVILFSASQTFADENAQKIDLPPVTQSEEAGLPEHTTHSILRLTPDKSELIRLEDPAASIIVGNPKHINVIADSSNTLVVIPRMPGATHFTVLGKKGQVIMQRHVIVASPKEDYVRIKRTCTGNSDDCAKTSVFYCPDMCHEISMDNEASEASSQNNADTNNGGGSNPPSGNSAPDAGPDQ